MKIFLMGMTLPWKVILYKIVRRKKTWEGED
jgi:hypothetical protein